MKFLPVCFLSACLLQMATAAVETWTNSAGKAVQLELVSVSKVDGVSVGEFKLANGQKATIKATDLIPADAKRLDEWKPAVAAAPSVFDDSLGGNLLTLDGKSLKRLPTFTPPTKYYLFYYTASWCMPCHKFTPKLVDFYNANKSPEFEVVLVTSDSDEKSMESYASDFKMPWPQLKLSKTERFKKEFTHPGNGIPNLVLTDLQGKLLKTSYEGETYLGPTTVMTYLGTLLKK